MSLFVSEKQIFIAGKIDRIVSNRYLVDTELIRSKNRHQDIVRARFMAWYILRKKFKWSFSRIGLVYKRDHSTIIHGVVMVGKLGLKDDVKNIIKTEFSTY